MKRLAVLIALLVATAIALAAYWISHPMDPINAANYERIEIGMTEKQVEQFLGPADPDDPDVQREFQGSAFTTVKNWSGSGRNVIRVVFHGTNGGVVQSKQCFIPGPLDFLKAWWGGHEPRPDFLLPADPVGGRSKRLDEAA
jgi:hypothetical protein